MDRILLRQIIFLESTASIYFWISLSATILSKALCSTGTAFRNLLPPVDGKKPRAQNVMRLIKMQVVV